MFGVMGSMEQDQLFQQAEDAQQTARRLVQEAREQARKARATVASQAFGPTALVV